MLQLAICHLPTYFGATPDREAIEKQASLLPEEFRNPILARTYLPSLLQSLGGMLLVRDLLGAEEFDRIAPAITHDKFGRPVLPDGSMDFNISHCGDYAVCALERDTAKPRVGLDIQSFPGTRHVDQIAKRFFTRDEYDYFSAHYDRTHAFLRVWTRKESLAKWKGDGLSAHIHRMDSMVAEEKEPIVFDEYIIGDAYLMTLCHRKGTVAPEQTEIEWM